MKTEYQIRNAQLDGIMISFNDEWEAMRWWRENVENAPVTDTRHGRVVVRHTWETQAEAETARLDFLIDEGGVAKFSAACSALPPEAWPLPRDWPKWARVALDIARKSPPDTTVVIWPNTVVSHTGALPGSKINPKVPSPGVGL